MKEQMPFCIFVISSLEQDRRELSISELDVSTVVNGSRECTSYPILLTFYILKVLFGESCYLALW